MCYKNIDWEIIDEDKEEPEGYAICSECGITTDDDFNWGHHDNGDTLCPRCDDTQFCIICDRLMREIDMNVDKDGLLYCDNCWKERAQELYGDTL